MSVGMYNGCRYRKARLCDMFYACSKKQAWWFLDDGTHFKTLRQLQQYLDTHGPIEQDERIDARSNQQ